MRKVHIITLARLNRAMTKVAGELNRHGLWDDRLRAVPVVLVPFAGCYGWQHYGGSGEICIPRLSLSKLHDFLTGGYVSLSDVLRHEYAHALADTHRGLMRSRHFTDAFGRSHEFNECSEFDPKVHISRYAATNSSEDFAENFMHYLKSRGTLPPKHSTYVIRRKWQFIHALCQAIQDGKTRW